MDGANCGFADGHASWYSAQGVEALTWDPLSPKVVPENNWESGKHGPMSPGPPGPGVFEAIPAPQVHPSIRTGRRERFVVFAFVPTVGALQPLRAYYPSGSRRFPDLHAPR